MRHLIAILIAMSAASCTTVYDKRTGETWYRLELNYLTPEMAAAKTIKSIAEINGVEFKKTKKQIEAEKKQWWTYEKPELNKEKKDGKQQRKTIPLN